MGGATKTATVICAFILWDFKQDPDFKEIEAVANWMLEHGAKRVHFARAETETDDGCLVVSESALSDGEATLAYHDWEDSIDPDKPSPKRWKPFIWQRRKFR